MEIETYCIINKDTQAIIKNFPDEKSANQFLTWVNMKFNNKYELVKLHSSINEPKEDIIIINEKEN